MELLTQQRAAPYNEMVSEQSIHSIILRRGVSPFESLPFVLLTLLRAAPCQTVCYSLEASAASYIRWNLPSCNYLFWEL